jgi:uncharacterized membrane protein YfcA
MSWYSTVLTELTGLSSQTSSVGLAGKGNGPCLAVHPSSLPAVSLPREAFGSSSACLGLAIGIVASLLGVAGGELLIPTFVLLFGADIKLAGSLSLVVSVPPMLMGFSRYSRDRSFGVIRESYGFLGAMAGGSVVGGVLGGRLVGVVPSTALLPALALLLLLSALNSGFEGPKPKRPRLRQLFGT